MDEKYVCKYCGKTFSFEGGGCNPSDYGLHYTDQDIYGREFTCIACDKLVTMTNRYIKYAIRDGFTKSSLQRVVEHVEWVRDNVNEILMMYPEDV